MSVQEPEAPYGGTTGERLKAFALNADTRDAISTAIARYWEVAVYGFLMLSAVILRFYNLGDRAMHHDESLHGYFSYGFTKGLEDFFTFGTANNDGYEHVPFMHGPFQFIASGFLMWIFGDGEYQARLVAAILGTAMVGMPWLLRNQLGKFGAIATAMFICFSPTLLYYSRFTREDIYTGFWTFGLVIFAWRYMATQKDYFLFLTAGFMAGLFLTKETSYMTVGAFVFFFEFLWAQHVANKIRARSEGMSDVKFVLLTLALIPTAWAIAFAWPFLENWRQKYELDGLPAEANLVIVMATLALPMYAALVQVPLGDTWVLRNEEGRDSHVNPDEFQLAMIAIFGLIGIGTAIGLLWRPKVWAIAAAAFWVPVVLLSTTFFSDMDGIKPDGFFSVVWGSLDYWLSQQDVRRGNQPDYYYAVTLPSYEYLPLLLSFAAFGYYAIKGNLRNAAVVAAGAGIIVVLLLLPHGPGILACHVPDPNPENLCPPGDGQNGVSITHVILPFTMLVVGVLAFRMEPFTKFLLFWAAVSAFGLSAAGEKMPWLNVHIAIALCVVAGKFVGDLVAKSDLREDLPGLERFAPFFYAAAAAGLATFVFVLVGPLSLPSVGAWLLAIVAGAAVYWAYREYSPRTAGQVALVGFVAAFAVLSFRTGFLAAWGHRDDPDPYKGDVALRDYGEVPREMLVYTQTSGDIPVFADRIADVAAGLEEPKEIPIVIDSQDGFTWPWAWYLRDSLYTNVQYANITADYTPPPGAIIFASANAASTLQLGDSYDPGIPYNHRRWFPEDYRGVNGEYSSRDFFNDLFNPSVVFGSWLDYWVRRDPPSAIGQVTGVAFFPRDANAGPQPPAETARTEGTQLLVGQTGTREGEMNSPSGTFIQQDGSLWVADTNNNRIQKFDAQGKFVSSIGGFGSDIAMTQPWSLVIADDGTMFVADTWAHRIQKFDASGAKVAEWGSGGQTDADGDGNVDDDDPFKLFGPRDIALAPNGNVLISDTGNNRIIEYTADGEFVRQFGHKGTGGGADELSEPVAIEVAANGDIYVGDFWNKRILVLNDDLELQREIAVGGWGSQQVSDRAYMVLLDDGRVLATDPTNGKIITFGTDGAVRGEYDVPVASGVAATRPVGLATDGTNILVADAAANLVRRIPLAEVAK